MTSIPVLNVFLYGQQIGTLMHLSGDKNLFSFDQLYIDNPQRPTLSLSFKDTTGELITNIRSTRTRVPPFFANLLPEGQMRDYLANRANVNARREFFLLSVLGSDLPGAISITPTIDEKIQEEFDTDLEKKELKSQNRPLRFSLAGLQLKFSAIRNANNRLTIPVDGIGGSWIVKLPSNHYKGVPENEYTMMELARNVGIDVPETSLIPVNEIAGLPEGMEKFGPYAFIIKRFDRPSSGDRVHIEDFAQVFGVYPEEKYEKASYRNIAEVIWANSGEKGLIEFIRRFVFNGLIGNGDMHLKNWSLIYPDQTRVELAPAYDFVSTIPYIPDEKLALKFVDSREFSSLNFDQFKRFAAKANLPEKLILDTVKETVQSFAEVWPKAKELPMDSEFRDQITDHLKTVPLWT